MVHRVSAVIASRDYGQYLTRAIESALDQEGCHVEVIVVDDGSMDTTPEVAARFSGRIHYLRTEGIGAAAARNLGWRTASDEIVCFLDADDYWLPDKVSTELRSLSSNSNCGLVYCDTWRISSDDHRIDLWSDHSPPIAGRIFLAQMESNRLQTSTVMVTKAVLEEMGGFDESLEAWEDIDLWNRIARRYEFVYVARPLACYRLHGGGLSSRPLSMAQGELRTVEKILSTLNPEEASPAWRRMVRANAFARVGVAHYLLGNMHESRRWLVRAWQMDAHSLLRLRSLETYAKSLLGDHLVTDLRRRLRSSGE